MRNFEGRLRKLESTGKQWPSLIGSDRPSTPQEYNASRTPHRAARAKAHAEYRPWNTGEGGL